MARFIKSGSLVIVCNLAFFFVLKISSARNRRERGGNNTSENESH